jgi:FAD:protein FMN transferase
MYEYEFSEHLMGTELSVSIITEDESYATGLYTQTLTRLKLYEGQFSRFLLESELSRLNTERSLVVSPLFITLLRVAQNLYKKTDGHFNPLLQIHKLGYTDTFEHIKAKDHAEPILPYNTNLNTVSIDEATRTVSLADDQKLDFGGFLKGYLAENEAKRIMYGNEKVQGVIVNIGGDIHTRGKDADGHIFVFDIQNPINGKSISIPLENTSLATSGTYRHAWNAHGAPVHHILARDGTHNPDSAVVSASVVHENGATAEAYAKTLMSIQPDTLQSMTDETFPFILIYKDGTIQTSL